MTLWQRIAATYRSRKDTLGFDDRTLFYKGVPILAILTNLLFFGALLKTGNYALFCTCMLISFVYTLVYWLIFREVHFYYISKFPSYDDTRKRIMQTVTTITIGYFFLYHIAKFLLETFIKPHLTGVEYPHPAIEIVSSIMFALLVFTLYEALYSTTKIRKILTEKESLEKSNIRSQLMGLRSQINPHFLFNSLNTLTALIHKDADRAENFATKLSKVYRYILEHRDDKLTMLTEELNWLNSYIHLLKERFGSNLHVDIDIDDPTKKKYILPLCLQITFENAIKHNIITKEKPLQISLERVGDYLHISNNLQRKHTVSSSTKFGLQNIKRRYQFFTNLEVKVIETADMFVVCLPLLKPDNILD